MRHASDGGVSRAVTGLYLVAALLPACRGGSSELGVTTAPAERSPRGDGDEVWGDPVNGLRSRIWTQEHRYRRGLPIRVKYAIRNADINPQVIWLSGFWPNNKIVVCDGRGAEVPLTPAGQKRREVFTPGGNRSKNIPYRLAPGEVYDAFQRYDLLQSFDLAEPGVYSVVYVYEERQADGWQGVLRSNTIIVEIIP
jgi:hypothetical protein